MKLWQRRTIGILTLGGGAVGTAAALGILITRTNPLEWVLCSLFIWLYAWGVWCGVKLLEQRHGAERLARKYWLVQVPTFGSPYVGYFLSSGFHATVSLQFLPFKVNGNFLLGSSFNYSLMQDTNPWFFGLNLFAAGIAWWLIRSTQPAAAEENKPGFASPVLSGE